MMEYKGYVAKVEFDDEAGLFHGQVLHLRDVITFQGRSVDELRSEFRESVEDYLEMCAERGEEPERPFSGRFLLRVSPELHRDVAIAASRAGQSLNAWVSDVLQEAVSPKRERAKEWVQVRAGGLGGGHEGHLVTMMTTYHVRTGPVKLGRGDIPPVPGPSRFGIMKSVRTNRVPSDVMETVFNSTAEA